MTRSEIKSKFDEIVEFAGVERYLDTPVKRYSSGMYVRLAFAVAAHLESEILILDEVLAVGDIEFQKKCLGKMKDVSEMQGRTVLFVSHNMQAIASLSTSALLMESGSSIVYPNCNHAIDDYVSRQSLNTLSFNVDTFKPICFHKISIHDNNGSLRSNFNHNEQIRINFSLKFNDDFENEDYTLFVEFLDRHRSIVFSSESSKIKASMLSLLIPGETFTRGNYSIRAFIHIATKTRIDWADDNLGFSVVDIGSSLNKHGDYNYGSVFIKTTWE
jgi:lipopolysaccharide transport system ATP-binding protein